MKKKKILIFTATYNEAENIVNLVEKVFEYSPKVYLLVVDDNSPDKTWEVLHQLERNLPNLKVIIRDDKSGLDTAHKLAYQYAKNNNYINFVSMDADLSHDPSEIPKIIDLLDYFFLSKLSINFLLDLQTYHQFLMNLKN